jgi:iron complex outermembrane recepter protein
MASIRSLLNPMHTDPYLRNPIRRALFLVATIAAATLASTAQAQSTPAVSDPPKAEEVIKLSEFQVSEKSPNAYIASETMTGTRINTKIADLPYSIVNLTQEFFKDFNINILDENMTLIGGLTAISIGGSFNLRGFNGSTSQMKDGFFRLGRYGLSNMDRIEIIRGPNAAIYGRSSPGGMINFISLQPKKQEEQELRLNGGRYDQYKGELYLTGKLNRSGSTYYVFDFAQRGRGFPVDYSHYRNDELFGAIQHDFVDGSHLKVSGEYFLQTQHSPQPGPPIVSQARTPTPDNAATSTVIGYDAALALINPYGPNSELNRGSITFNGAYDKQFNDIWSTRIGGYYFRARRWDYNQNNGWGGITIPLNGGAVTTTRGPLPSRGEIMEDGGGFQADLVAHYFLANRSVENKTLFTVDLNDYYRWDPAWTYGPNTDPDIVAWTAAGSGRVVTLTSPDGSLNYVPTSPVAYFPKWYTTSNLALFAPGGNSITGGSSLNGGSFTRRRATSLGGNIRQQVFLFNGRLIGYAGVRNDTVRFSMRDYTVAFDSSGFPNMPAGTGKAGQPGGSVVRRLVHQNKPNLGFNYKATPNLAVYGSYSEAYYVSQTASPAQIAASTYKPFTSKGYDYGIKGNYFDQKLNFTLGGYYTVQNNVSVTDRVESPLGSGTFVDISRQDGDQLCRGWEADLSWVINDSLIVGSSFGRTDSRYTFFGSAFPEALGRSVNGITPENGSAYLKYTILRGPAKGLYLNLLANYASSTPTQSPTAGDTTVTTAGVSTVTAHTDAWKLRSPSYTVWTFSANYRLPRLNRSWDQTIGLTVYNLSDKAYLRGPGAQAGDRRSILVSYTLGHRGSMF